MLVQCAAMNAASTLPAAEQLVEQLIEQVKHLPANLNVVGIHTGGAWVAQRVHAALKLDSPLGLLSSAFHRDDYGKSASSAAASRVLGAGIRATEIGFEVNGAHILLVDDILYTGRTIRAALNELFDFGRPASVQLAVLIDRGGRQLPIQADYVGVKHELPPGSQYVLSRDTQGRLHLGLEH
jgi:pyrimidine operon attenuation protein / uracil phosphoribosyltransferase